MADTVQEVVIIDGQGGMLGKQLVESVRRALPTVTVTAIGTNSVATASMMKAGAHQGATGENAVIVAARRARIIAGPVGIVIADSLLGEITPAMAAAVGGSDAVKFLLPVNRCNNIIVGVEKRPMGKLVEEAVARIVQELDTAR